MIRRQPSVCRYVGERARVSAHVCALSCVRERERGGGRRGRRSDWVRELLFTGTLPLLMVRTSSSSWKVDFCSWTIKLLSSKKQKLSGRRSFQI